MKIQQQNKNMMAPSPSHRQFQSQRMKVLLKEALKKRQISIQSLKKSFYVNHSHLDGFVKYMKDPSNFFPTSTNEYSERRGDEEETGLAGLRNIVKNINRKTPATKDIFLKRNSIKGKQIKKQLKLQRSQLKIGPQTSTQTNILSNSFYKPKHNYPLQNFKQKMIALDVRSTKVGNNSAFKKGRNNMRNAFSVHMLKFQNENLTPSQIKFGKTSDKVSTHRRWKTEGELKSQQRSLSELTKYCERKNVKGINYLVLQLQLNVQGSKKMRKTTGPFY